MSNDATTPKDPATPPQRFDLADAFGLFTRGLAMGAADVVPGVSGGTIAFISGIYERFIAALRSLDLVFVLSLLRLQPARAWRQLRGIHWFTLIPLGAGIAIAMLTMSKLIIGLMDDKPGHTYAFFFGLILASAWMPFAHMRRFAASHGVTILVAALAAWFFVGLRAGPIELVIASADTGAQTIIYPSKIRSAADALAIERAIAADAQLSAVLVFDPNAVLADRADIAGVPLKRLESREAAEAFLAAPPPLIVLGEKRASLAFIFLCGALAISAMILPGISGSFLLLFLGQYQAVFSTIHQTVGHATRLAGRAPDPLVALTAQSPVTDFLFLAVFGVGILVGLATFSRIVGWLFAHAHDITMAALTGLMLGALRQPGQVVLDASARASGASSYWIAVVAVGVMGAVIVLGLHFADLWLKARRARHASNAN